MNEKTLIEKMSTSVEGVPAKADILSVRQYYLEELEERTNSILDKTGEIFGLPLKRKVFEVQNDRTIIRMPLGAFSEVYHASGAIKLSTGLKPMDELFKSVDERENLEEMIKDAADRLNIRKWIGKNESIAFERLWQIKACAASRDGQSVKPTLCRIVGAYRHSVGGLPVLGPASIAIKLAANGVLDSMTIQIRETTGDVIDRVETLRPNEVAHQIFKQLSGLMGKSKGSINEAATLKWMRFGYMSLPKRKAQHLLAPVYIAAISLDSNGESQAHIFVASATEEIFLPISPLGSEAPPSHLPSPWQSPHKY